MWRRTYAHKYKTITNDMVHSCCCNNLTERTQQCSVVKKEEASVDDHDIEVIKIEGEVKIERLDCKGKRSKVCEKYIEVICLSDDDDGNNKIWSSTPVKSVFKHEMQNRPSGDICVVDLSKIDVANEETLLITTKKDVKIATDLSGKDEGLNPVVASKKRKRTSESLAQTEDNLVHSSTNENCSKGVQVDLQITEFTNQMAGLTKEVEDLNRSNAELSQEIAKLKQEADQKNQDQQRYLSEKEEEMQALKRDFKNKENKLQRSLSERDLEITKLKENLKLKEIGLVAATSLLGLSMEEVVRKSVEAQIARVALVQQKSLVAPAVLQSQASVQPLPSSTADLTGKNNVQSNTGPPGQTSQPSSQVSPSKGYCKGEYTRRNRRSVGGVFEDAFPLQQDALKELASGSNVAEFVRSLLLHCFTDEYLETNTLSKMNEAHVDIITDAAVQHFTDYRTKKDTVPQSLNRPTVRTFIKNTLSSFREKAQKKKNKATSGAARTSN